MCAIPCWRAGWPRSTCSCTPTWTWRPGPTAAPGRVSRVVLVTSAMVYGARPDNPVPLPESAPLAADPDGSVVGDLLEIEDLARRSPRTNPGMGVTVVRPAALVGAGVDTFVTRHFEAPRLLVVKGSEPRWQFCHTDDLVSALELAVAGEVTGAFAVGCDGWLEQDQVEEMSGLRRIELPAGLTFGAAQRLHRVGITPAPATPPPHLARHVAGAAAVPGILAPWTASGSSPSATARCRWTRCSRPWPT